MHKKAYIVHGYSASPASHWFTWLADQLTPLGIKTHILPMPDSAHPIADTWIGYLDRHIDGHNKHTYLIGHSLGCITLLRHLDRLPAGTRIGGLILAAGFMEPLTQYPNLDPFTAPGFDHGKVIATAAHRAVIVSDNDPIVPPEHTQNLSRAIDAQLYTEYAGGHLMAQDGYTTFPLLQKILSGMLDS